MAKNMEQFSKKSCCAVSRTSSETDPKLNNTIIQRKNTPDKNSCLDGYFGTAPAKSFPPNGFGL